MAKTVLVLGVGNVLLSDEGIGVHVVRRLQSMELPPEVEAIDGGTTGYELIRFFAGRERVIIVDCIRADEPAGTIICATPEQLDLQWDAPSSVHQFGLSELLYHARLLPSPPEILIVGIIPKTPSEAGTEVSESLKPLLDVAASKVLQLASESRR